MLSWVSIINSITSGAVQINAIGVKSGKYTLVLESVDKNSKLPDLVLKTDKISIIVPVNRCDRNFTTESSIILVVGRK